MTLAIPPGFLRDETTARIGCDWLEERDTPLADVLLWYARLDEPEGPPTALVGEYAGRLTGDAVRAALVKAHRVVPGQGLNPLSLWVLVYPSDGDGDSHHFLHRLGPPVRRRLQRRVLGLFPEVRVVLTCPQCGGTGRTEGQTLYGFPVVTADGSCIECMGRRVVTVRAPDLVPPEADPDASGYLRSVLESYVHPVFPPLAALPPPETAP